MPSPDTFAALARSSPWRWATLRFSVRWYPDGRHLRPVRAWLRRPVDVRVEPLESGTAVVIQERANGRPLPGDADFLAPPRRPDGLVARRGTAWDDAFDAPMYNSYFWVAMLDPVELAEGRDPETGERRPGTLAEDITEVDHFGRAAWEAVVRTTPAYQPRCACCALLWSRESDLIEFGPDGRRDDYPDAYRVRLDAGSGVCVLTEELDGSARGRGHAIRIEAVDEPMDDELFRAPPP